MISQFATLNPFASALLVWSLAAAIVVIVGTVVDHWLRYRSASDRHLVWLATAGCVAALPAISLLVPGILPATVMEQPELHLSARLSVSEPQNEPLPVDTPPLAPVPAAAIQVVESISTSTTLPSQPVEPVDSPQPAYAAIPTPAGADGRTGNTPLPLLVGQGILLLWAAGLWVFFVRWFVARRKLAAEFRQASCQPEDSLSELASSILEEEGLTLARSESTCGVVGRLRQVSVFVTSRDVGPLVSGSMPAQLLLPQSLNDLPCDARAAAIRHELAHVRRGDEWVRRGLLALRLTFWFHPLIRFCCNRVQLFAEFACDDHVLRRGHDARTYSKLLLAANRWQPSSSISVAATSGMAQSQVAKRIGSIVRVDISRLPASWRIGVGVSAVMLGLTALVSAIRPMNSDRTSQALAGQDTAQNTTETAPGRVLSFPDDRVIGSLETRPKRLIQEPADLYDEWQPLGPARGDVAIPAGHEAKLWVSADGARDLSFLTRLPADALFGLNLWRSRAEDSQTPHIASLTGLQYLRLEDTRITAAGLKNLAPLTRLRGIQFDAFMSNRRNGSETSDTPPVQCGFDDESITVLLSMPNLMHLNLRQNPITSDCIPTLAKLTKLEWLSLAESAVTDEHLELLAELPSLKLLDFGAYRDGAPITDAGAAKIATLTELRVLGMNGTKITREGLAALATLPKLEKLSLDGVAIESQDLSLLKDAPNLKQLTATWSRTDWDSYARALSEIKSLEVVGQNIPVDREGLALLLTLPNLRELSVIGRSEGEDFTGIGEALAQCVNLERLSLQRLPIDDVEISKLGTLKQLRRLGFYRTGIDGSCLPVLAEMPRLESLSLESDDALDLSQLPLLPNLTAVNLDVPSDSGELDWVDKIPSARHLSIGMLVRDRHLPMLARLTELESLLLENAALSDRGVALLSPLKKVDYLSIGGGLTMNGLRALDQLPSLQSLWVASPYFGETERSTLEQMLGSVSVNFQGGEHSMFPSNRDGFLRMNSESRLAHEVLEGSPAPELEVGTCYNTEGPSIDLIEYRGKVVLIDFWAAWCGPCKRAIPMLKGLREKYRDQGFEIIGIHESSSIDELPALMESSAIPWPVAIDRDNATSKALSNPHYPCYYLVDQQGIIRMANLAPEDLAAAIKELLDEEK